MTPGTTVKFKSDTIDQRFESNIYFVKTTANGSKVFSAVFEISFFKKFLIQ